MTTLCRCGKPTNGVTHCADCKKTVRIAIANVAAYWDDLETVRTRQTRYGVASKGSIGKSMPLGMDGRFTADGRGTKAQDATRNAVSTWARALLDDRPGTPRDTTGASGVRGSGATPTCSTAGANATTATATRSVGKFSPLTVVTKEGDRG